MPLASERRSLSSRKRQHFGSEADGDRTIAVILSDDEVNRLNDEQTEKRHLGQKRRFSER